MFEELIKALGQLMGIPLVVDEHGVCVLELEKGLLIHLDPHENGEQLLMGCELGEVKGGRYAEQLFLAALRVNGLNRPQEGILAYSTKNSSLVLFSQTPLEKESPQELFSSLQLFGAHARRWKEALQRGELPASALETSGWDRMHGLNP